MEKQEKVKLSDLIKKYEEKKEKTSPVFGTYFCEEDLYRKLETLHKIYNALGDVEMLDEHFKAFLYLGRYRFGDEHELTDIKIKHLYNLVKDYNDMSAVFVYKIFELYDEVCFKKIDVKTYIEILIDRYQYSDQTLEKYSQFMKNAKEQIVQFYTLESEKTEMLKEQYGEKFTEKIKRVICNDYVEYNRVLEILPSKEFIDNSKMKISLGYDIYAGEDLVIKTLKGQIDLEKYGLDENVCLGFSSDGGRVYTPFTKEEYLKDIKQKEQIRKKVYRG